MFRPLRSALLATLEARLNSLLSRDPWLLQRLPELADRCIELQLQEWPEPLYLRLLEQSLRLQLEAPEQVDARVQANLSQLLARLADPSQPLAGSGIQIDGDHQLLQQIQRLYQGFDPDWEGWLAEHLGDIPAHLIGKALQQQRTWLARSRGELHADLREYLQEESGLLPTPIEVEDWIEDIRQARLHLDRLEARLQQLEQQQG
ncbi:ubiquinone biosynthesis accessory factor UbiJ [Balneatrix alpica]|uniref:ubiquinone biosynthesis accessory factor UbiJ n=1 Tax=Balneatrix alpica TaxID=75684 RepID=UPI002739FD52|nr:SCP2 sterol-binding domain-containing protein [Balneatrix alpica]